MERRNGINKRWMMMSFFNEGEKSLEILLIICISVANLFGWLCGELNDQRPPMHVH